jgi:hypothetical protein
MARGMTATRFGVSDEGLGAQAGNPVETTLLELVQALGELTDDDREIVATVVDLLRTGRVRLIGTLRGQRIAVA